MRQLLALALILLALSRPAFADHIGIYRDASGASCRLDPGYSTNGTVIHKFSMGATGSSFRVDFSQAPGSTFIAFHSPFVPVGDLTTGMSVGYEQCATGHIVVGTIEAILSPGYLSVAPKMGWPYIDYSTCDAQNIPATGGMAIVGPEGVGDCFDANTTEQSTWGSVKALYR